MLVKQMPTRIATATPRLDILWWVVLPPFQLCNHPNVPGTIETKIGTHRAFIPTVLRKPNSFCVQQSGRKGDILNAYPSPVSRTKGHVFPLPGERDSTPGSAPRMARMHVERLLILTTCEGFYPSFYGVCRIPPLFRTWQRIHRIWLFGWCPDTISAPNSPRRQKRHCCCTPKHG